jgi:hypothetical protein
LFFIVNEAVDCFGLVHFEQPIQTLRHVECRIRTSFPGGRRLDVLDFDLKDVSHSIITTILRMWSRMIVGYEPLLVQVRV